MKHVTTLCILAISIFVSSSAFAECPTELPVNQLIDCIALEEHEPDITELMAEEAAMNKELPTRTVKTDTNTISSLTK